MKQYEGMWVLGVSGAHMSNNAPVPPENKEERNKKAFEVLDTSSDGKLQLSEVLDALIPDAPNHNKFLAALGFDLKSAKETTDRLLAGEEAQEEGGGAEEASGLVGMEDGAEEAPGSVGAPEY